MVSHAVSNMVPNWTRSTLPAHETPALENRWLRPEVNL